MQTATIYSLGRFLPTLADCTQADCADRLAVGNCRPRPRWAPSSRRPRLPRRLITDGAPAAPPNAHPEAFDLHLANIAGLAAASELCVRTLRTRAPWGPWRAGAPQRLSLSLPFLAPHPGPSAAATRCSCRGGHSCGPGLIGRCSLGRGLAPACADTAGCPYSFQVCALHCLPRRAQGGRAISRRLGFLHFEQRPHWGNSCNCALSTASIGFHDAACLPWVPQGSGIVWPA